MVSGTRVNPPPELTLAKVTFSLFLSKIQPAVCKPVSGGETTRVGELSHLGSYMWGNPGKHINALAHLTGTTLSVVSVT